MFSFEYNLHLNTKSFGNVDENTHTGLFSNPRSPHSSYCFTDKTDPDIFTVSLFIGMLTFLHRRPRLGRSTGELEVRHVPLRRPVCAEWLSFVVLKHSLVLPSPPSRHAHVSPQDLACPFHVKGHSPDVNPTSASPTQTPLPPPRFPVCVV